MSSGSDPTVVAVEPSPNERERSPCDVLRLVVSAVLLLALLVVEWLSGDTLVRFTGDLLHGTGAIPAWLLDAVLSISRLLAAAFLVGGFVVTLLRARWHLLALVVLAAALAALLVAVLGFADPAPRASVAGLDSVVPSTFPTATGLAGAAAVVTAAAPWLTRRWRRLGWIMVVAMTFSRFIVSPVAFDSLRAFLTGWLAGSAALVVLGGPIRRASGAAVAAGLAAVGVPLARLERAGVDARGSTPYFAGAADGRRLFVKVLGADERSADLLFRLYRWVLPRNFGDERPFSSLRRTVEHEALLALSARDLGIRTPHFVALARAEPNSFVLAYEAIDGSSLDGVEPDELTDDLLRAVWGQVADLHRHRIAHRDLRLANVFRAADGTVWMIDFGFSELAARDLLVDTDRAELLASTATRVGTDRALQAALAVVEPATLARAANRLRPWALSGATRTALKQDPTLLPALRDAVTRAT
ncbi:MAG: lipopolysaccharide kinase InaA family protein [Acidimicrobiia bacterium]